MNVSKLKEGDRKLVGENIYKIKWLEKSGRCHQRADSYWLKELVLIKKMKVKKHAWVDNLQWDL